MNRSRDAKRSFGVAVDMREIDGPKKMVKRFLSRRIHGANGEAILVAVVTVLDEIKLKVPSGNVCDTNCAQSSM